MLYPSIDTLFKRDHITRKLVQGDYKNEIFSLIKEWEWTEKIDGTNIRVIYDCSTSDRDLADMQIGGRTEAAQLPAGVVNYIQNILTVDKLYDLFGTKNVVIFGEGYGHNIQNGGGYIHPDDPISQKFIVFDIVVGGKYWLKREDVVDICEKLGLDVVPLVDAVMSLPLMPIYPGEEEHPVIPACLLVEHGFKSLLGDRTKDAEGLVGRTKVPLFDAKHRRIITKLKTKDFLGTEYL